MTQKLRWTPTVHAIQRLKERFNTAPVSAVNFVNQIMAQASYISAGKAGKLVYYYEKRDMMIVVNPDENVIVTVHEGSEPEAVSQVVSVEPTQAPTKLTLSNFVQAVKREYKRMLTQTQREIRKLSEQQALLNVDLAQLTLNFVKCDAPHTKALIQSRIDDIKAQIEAIKTDINVKSTQISEAEKQVKAVVGE